MLPFSYPPCYEVKFRLTCCAVCALKDKTSITLERATKLIINFIT